MKTGEAGPLLRVAEHWLRSELQVAQSEGQHEREHGQAAIQERDPTQQSTNSAGGFAAGRMAAYDFIGGR